MFYQNSLLESGVVEDLDCFGAWEELSGAAITVTPSPPASAGPAIAVAEKVTSETARRPFLVLFRSLTSGTHQHDRDSPSFYNISEIACVVELCTSLIRSSSVHVTPQDIGIIGAFRAQVCT
jgi:hypothetical protein